MQSLVSVVVPVYKVEKYLDRCLDSLCRQSLHDIEIILVDDASPDRCGDICEKYALKDTRFKVIHHPENRGLSAARNTGIANATSDYLMFVDSDDYVHEDFCKLPYECAIKKHVDLVLFNLFKIKQQKIINLPESKRTIVNLVGYKTQSEAIDLLFCESTGSSACNKLYNKNLFKSLLFPEGRFYEDWSTTYKIIWQASHIYYLENYLYYYCLRTNSITSLHLRKVLDDKLDMAVQQSNELHDWGYSSAALDLNVNNVALSYCMYCKRDNSNYHYMLSARILHTCNRIPADFSWKRKFLLFIFKISTQLFELVCIVCGKKRF